MKNTLLDKSMLKIFSSSLVFFILGMMIICLPSCTDEINDEENENVLGMRPIYSTDIGDIKLLDARSISETGKIVYLEPYIFISEKNQGIHVVNNSNPEDPVFEAFIQIPYTLDFSIKNNILYAQTGNDIVSLKLEENSITELSRVKNANTNTLQRTPGLEYSGWFECVDLNRGFVVKWEEARLDNPKCYK